MKYEELGVVAIYRKDRRRAKESGVSKIRNGGFTLPELLTAMAIAGILLAITIPSFRTFIQNDSLVTQANTMVYALNYARSEAVKRDTSVALCPSTDGASCISSPTNSSWSNGWILYYTVGTTNTVLQAWPALNTGYTLKTWTYGTGWTAASLATITYQSTGLIFASNGSLNTTVTTNYFVICDSRGATKAADVELSPTGRAAASLYPGYTTTGPTPANGGSAVALKCG